MICNMTVQSNNNLSTIGEVIRKEILEFEREIQSKDMNVEEVKADNFERTIIDVAFWINTEQTISKMQIKSFIMSLLIKSPSVSFSGEISTYYEPKSGFPKSF